MGAQLTLTWIAGSSNQTGFSIERSTGTTGTFAEIIATGPSAASYTDSSLADAATYCYRLRAFNAAGYSGYSPVGCGTTSQSFGLAAVKMGAGSGTITSAPAGITCGASCSATYPCRQHRHPHRDLGRRLHLHRLERRRLLRHRRLHRHPDAPRPPSPPVSTCSPTPSPSARPAPAAAPSPARPRHQLRRHLLRAATPAAPPSP